MTTIQDDKNRSVIPRWRLFAATIAHGELDATSRVPQVFADSAEKMQEVLAEWKQSPDLAHAADVVSKAITLGADDVARDAADAILRAETGELRLAVQLANWVKRGSRPSAASRSGDYDSRQSGHAIRQLRQTLRGYPQNPAGWADLSFLYASSGEIDEALRSMSVAMDLAGTTRFVSRAASRLALHVDDPDKAVWILDRALRASHDPWILAALIAAHSASGRRYSRLRQANSFMDDHADYPFHISELASAIATVELATHASKKSRKLFQLSLKQPTENAIAQAAWAGRKHDSTLLESMKEDVIHQSAEACAWQAFQEGSWRQALDFSMKWHADQPFSARPTILASYVAMVGMENYKESERVAAIGLKTNPQEFLLANNRTVALALDGQSDAARDALSGIPRAALQHDEDRLVYVATCGLVEYRSGNPAAGRSFYEAAISASERLRTTRLMVMALLFYAREEAAFDRARARSAYERARKRASGALEKQPDVGRLLVSAEAACAEQ